MKESLLRLVEAGTGMISDITIRRHVIFSNIIYLSLPFVYAGYMLFGIEDAKGLFKFDRIIDPVIIALCLGCYYLNRIGMNILARILFPFFWILSIHVIPIIIKQTPSDYYLAFPVGIIFDALLIQMSFSARKERWLFWSLMIANFILLFFSLAILVANDPLPDSSNVVRIDFYYRIDEVTYWLLFNLLVYYLLYVVEDNIEKLDLAKSIIANQKNELELTNIELAQLNYSLSMANQTLEARVDKRTQELTRKNDQLVQYAHFNAHQLRGPYARVRGLINLLVTQKDFVDEPEVNKRLQKSLDELNSVISYIQRTVE